MSAEGRLVIVAGVQFDATADAVWDKAETLLWSRPDARLHLCHVIVTAAAIKAEGSDKLPSLVDEGLAKLHEWVAKKAGGADNPICMQIHLDVALGVPADEIVQSAVDAEADLILLGTHGRTGVARLVLGSVAEAVLHKAPCSVLIARGSDYADLTKSPSLAPAPEPGHRPYRPHPSSVRSSIVFSSYDSAIYPTGASRKSIH
jgi:nucleotide-binding universal stress UspA family protein